MVGKAIVSLIAERQNLDQFRRKNWVGTFEEYLDLVREKPAPVTTPRRASNSRAASSSTAT